MDGWYLGKGPFKALMKLAKMNAATDVYDPRKITERRAVARDCEEALKYGMPTLVDEMDDEVNEAYAAWPTRLYLIGLDGRIAYHGGLGPFDFYPSKLGAAIEEYLGQMEEAVSDKL